MYVPEFYQENDAHVLFDFIRQNPLGSLITYADGELDANHLPFVLVPETNDKPFLFAHVARLNTVWQKMKDGEPVLVIFKGEQGYISPNWYPSKQESENQVPTWNYQVVHVHGKLSVHDDPKFVRGVVGRLTSQHEATQAKPWKMTDSSPEYINDKLTHIVGIKIEIVRLEGKFKLSQNRSQRDMMGATEGLQRSGKGALAEAMLESQQREMTKYKHG